MRFSIIECNLLTSHNDSALWDNEKDCERVTEVGSGQRSVGHFSEVIKLRYDAFASFDLTYLDPCSDNAAGTIGRRWRSEVLEVELNRRWDRGLACYW